MNLRRNNIHKVKTLSSFQLFVLLVMSLFLFSSCEFMLGSKHNDEVDDIFEQGKIDPNTTLQNVGYVPILPIWTSVSHPVDVFVGYDEMVYIIDDAGLKIFDLKGELKRSIPIYKAKEVTQDRRIHTYVLGKVVKKINGIDRELSAVYHLNHTASASGPEFIDTLVHPFCDVSRNNIPFRNQDLQVEFNGLGCRADNILYVSRKGPVNDQTSSARPDNAVLFYDENGKNISYAKGLYPLDPNLKSAVGISALATFAGPPQKIFGMNESHDFIICQADQTKEIEYRVLWITESIDPDAGITYGENSALLEMDLTKANGFLYEPNKFKNPVDVYIAPDQTGYIFVVDDETDMLYQFTPKGYEGVSPPANSSETKYIKVSFGGEGSGPFEFNDPTGVCYFNKIVYVADKNNNRIMRFRLNTDIE